MILMYAFVFLYMYNVLLNIWGIWLAFCMYVHVIIYKHMHKHKVLSKGLGYLNLEKQLLFLRSSFLTMFFEVVPFGMYKKISQMLVLTACLKFLNFYSVPPVCLCICNYIYTYVLISDIQQFIHCLEYILTLLCICTYI